MEQEVIEGYRLSPQQEYLWLLCQQDTAAHRTRCALRLEGELHKSLLQEALQQVVEQHEILRTAFRGMPSMTMPLQVILDHGTWSWREVDLTEFAEEEQSSQLAALQRTESERDFNHEQGEVLYACLAMLAPARHVLLLNISPLCADSWSLQNLVRELGRRYTALLSGAEVTLEAVQYADFSEWQHKLLNAEGSEGRDFWRKQNVSSMPVLRLPLEKDGGEKYQPEYITLKSDAELVHELETLARANDVSLSELLLAAWSSLLWRLTGEREIVIGAAVDGGRYKELGESLGLFTKYLPAPLRFAATSSFQEIIKRVAASYRDACRRQEYYTPGEGHAAEEGLGYEYEEREETVDGFGPLRVAVISEESCRSRQRVLLQCRYQSDAKRLELRLRYDAGCYSPVMIKLLAERLEMLLVSVAKAPRAELKRVALLGEAERGLLREWGTGTALERVEACETLGEMLEQQARPRGNTAAVVDVDEVLTFSELNARANQLGRYLRKRGVGPEAVVGILLERSSRMVECVCGVWKAGAAYLPLDPGAPSGRLARVLKQAGVRMVVTEQGLAGLLAGTGVEVLEWEAVRQQVSAEETSEPEVAVNGENLAYVIYTSGSTGAPKGVMIEQRSVLHLLGGLRQEVYGENNDERCVRVGMNAPLSFDASVKQLVQVLRGKTLVVIPEELRLEAGPLLSYLAQREVDVLDCTPAQLRLLRADAGEAQWPRLLLVGGEAIDAELWRQLGNWSETVSVNLYGPTEATVDTTWKRISGPSPSIGRPLPQVPVYLLDQYGEQAPLGQVGEVYIGGRSVARGYLQAAELTAERFVPDGYGDERGGRLYRTGDLARYREDGELEYVGRTDRQVKLRGFRIELGEVEAALLDHEGVKATAAVVRHDEEKEERLVAYVVPKRQQAAIIDGQGFSKVAEHPLHTAKLEEQVAALYQLPNKLEVFHHNRNETEHLYHQIFEHQFYLKHGISIKPGDCIFDVGANIGLFTLFVYHQVRNASVYSFEPIPSNFEKLRNNVALYGLDANLFNCGLSDREGTATFTFYPHWSACSGVYANVEEEEETLKTFLINQGESVAEYADELIEGRYEGEQVVCQLRTLSEVIRQHNIERIDLLKLDVEKSEWDVLEGIEADDWQKIRQVVVEVHDLDGRLERMQQLLAEHGFVAEAEQEIGLVGTNIYSLYARRIEAEEAAEVRNGNGTARLWRESLALGAAEAEVSEAELRSYLRERLPEYMVPQALVILERMPLSRHGKIDYQRLPAPEPVESDLEAEAARGEVEELLAGIWSEVLGLVHVGREKNFFELGGHSLLATQVMSRVRAAFGVEVRLRELFERPTVKELGQSIERELRQGAGVAPAIERRGRVGELPLSFAQQRLWFIDQFEPESAVYNVPVAVRLQGSLNQEALAQTLSEVIRRHEVLRTRFGTVDGRVVQVVEAAAPVELAVVELSALEIEEREARVHELAAQEAARPFDLSRGPLLRVKLLRLGEQEHVVLLTMHHIVSDGWSVGVLIKEVGTLYAAYAAGEESPLEELPIQYADFALWQRDYLQGEVLGQQMAYWRRQLSDAPRLLDLPSNHPRPAVRSFHGEVERFELDQELSEKLRALSQRESVTLFMLLLAVFKVLLMKYARQADIVIGADVANRNRAETENLIGFFVNMLVLRTDLSGDPTFSELLHRVREVCLEAYAHQDLPFEKLVEELQPERSLSYAPLFQVVFALQNAPAKDLHLPELTLSTVGAESGTAKFDLVFNLHEADQQLVGSMEYSTDLFEAETIKRMLGHFRTLLAAVVADPAQQLSRLPLLTEAEAQQRAEWNNNTIREYPRDTCIHQLFEAQVERTPEAVAVSLGQQRLSYRELNARANQLAHHLQKLGVASGARVGIYLTHSLETLIAILGVLKAGAAYVPSDPEHPLARLHFMIEDAQLAVLLTESALAERLGPMSDVRLLCLDSDWAEIATESEQNPSPQAVAEDLAYVIYTSGSTGTPKGVKIQHRALVNYIWWAKDVYVQDEKLDFPLYSSLAFDLTVTSIFTPLLSGNRVLVYRPDRSTLAEILKDDQVGVLKLTPSHLALLKDADNSQSHVKRLIVGGEAFEAELARQVYESFGRQVEIYNEYGPTEATVGCMIHRFDPARVELASVPIGRPAANVQIYILDEHLLPAPANVVGEVYIAGDGLAAGYLNRAELTAASFIANPFVPEQRMYRTKDLGRWLAEQEIEYVGRQDEQVKFHGYRVELNEIRSVLNGYPGVRDSVVLVRKKPGNDLMIAYYAARQEIEVRQLREFMAQSLIKETIPNVFVHLKKLPLTLNGKVNLKALPDLEEARPATKQVVLAQTPMEEVLAGIWSEVLGLAQIGRKENFFELGGHSLLGTQVISRVREAFGVEVGLRELFERPTVKELGQSIERELRQGAGMPVLPITSVDRDRELPLSFAQQRLWFIDQLEPGGTVYNIPLAVRLSGALNVPALEQTLNEIIRRHEVLRTSFAVVDEQPVQVIEPAVSLNLAVQELTGLPEAERETEVLRLTEAEAHQPFELSRGPLLRAKLWRLSESEHVVLLTMHHIIADGWSLGVLINEVAALYRAFAAGEAAPLPELPVQYADFALWQREWLAGEELERQLSYWRQQLADAPALLELPTDRPRPPLQTFNGADEAFTLSAETTQSLHRLSRSSDVTLFMTLLAVWQVLLQRYSGQQDIVVGTSIANRNRAETEGLIGFFVNMLALRTNVAGDPTFLELLNRVKEVCLGAYAHQDLPFEKLVEELEPERSLNHSPLFQVVFVLQNAPMGALELPGLVLSTIEQQRAAAQFDLTLGVQEAEGQLSGTLRYNTDLFEAETIKRMLGHFETLLAAVVANPAQQLSTLPLLTEAEEQQLAEWSNTTRAYPRDACIHQLFEAQVERTPEAVAISFGAQEISYRELNERANQLAHYLQGLGLGPESLVALYLDRSAEMVIAMLAVLKAGAAYLPLELSLPAERVAFMLHDADAAVLVTEQRFHAELSVAGAVKIVCLDTEQATIEVQSAENLASGVEPENLAYVMYTSGSTGQPKGVSVMHRSVVRLVKETNYIEVLESDVFLQAAPISFDASTFEVWGSLLNGAQLVLLEQQRPTLEELARAISSKGVTVLWLTAGLFHLMVDEQGEQLLQVRRLLAGGDVLAGEQVRKYLAQMGPENRLINGYGPTENTTFTCCHTMERESRWEGSVPIGRPISNSTVYILDRQQRRVPVGVYGEIYAGGDGLAREYLKRPALTAEKFVPHSFSTRGGDRLYRTGDIGRWLNDGSIEYLGRLDEQVKLRGFRIELGEIEAVLNRHAAVREAVAVVQTVNDDKRLVAYVVGEESLESGELRQYLKGVLPEYMVPQVFVQMERLPLTANGKVDRHALPAVELSREETEIVVAQTPVEEVLVGIWNEVLGVVVGVEDEFFELGGHSLLATQVMSRVRKAFGVEIALRELFERPTVKELGQSIERELRQGAGVGLPPIERREREGELPLSFAQQRLWFIDQMAPGGTVYNIPLAVRLSGTLNVAALEQTLNEIIRRHEVLRTSFAVVDEQPVQVIAPALSLSLTVQEITGVREPEREAEVMRLAEAEARQPFDLSQAPLLRAKLLQLNESEHVVLLTMHHIITDGWSLGVLISEVAALYRAFAAGEPAPLPELPVQYADFALWQREHLQGEELERQLGYWRQQLADAPALLELPTDRPRPPLQTFDGAHEAFTLSTETTQALHRLSRSSDATLFMTLLAVWQVLLQRYSGQQDIVVGTSIANRNRAETEGLIGFFVNMLVLRTNHAGDPTFLELLKRVKEVCLGAYAHQDLPFEKLVEELQPERSLNHSPLFQVVFALQNAPMEAVELPGLVLSPIERERAEAQFDLIVNVQEAEGQLHGMLHYNTDLFEAETIKRMLGHFQTLLAAVVADPAQQLSRLSLLTEAEAQQRTEWNNTTHAYPRDVCIHQLFEAQVERTPEAVAVSFGEQRLSYRELNARANQLAHHLQKLGVAPGARVGIYLTHSLETLIAILGVLKAGAAYVPSDPEHPLARLHFMIEDAQLAVLLTESGLAERLGPMNDTRLLCLDSDWEEIATASEQNPSPRAVAENLAYVIYTSGSTGTPKGVKIQHRALVNYIWWAKDVYLQNEKLDFPLYSSLAFDLTVTSIFTPLLSGNRVVVYRPDRSTLAEILKDDQVGVLKLTPSHLALLKDADNSESHVKRLIVGGEAFEAELARQVYESFGRQVEIYNEYGPTEATVGCMIYRFDPARVELASVPIGRPAANVQIYILDEHLLPVPANVVGEVYIAGDGLAAGYLNRAELTAASFIANPFVPEQRMYRTKDLGRWLAEQEIEYVGRQDEQVKFHGYRVELNEIRSVLNGYPGVRDSVVLVRKKPGNDLMIAYYAARQEIEARQLREFMAQSLIKETIPNVFVHLKKLPLTLNGKVNLKALPDLEESRLATKHQYQATRTPIEAALATIWEEILSVRQIGLDANFFELGGHSLLVTQVISRVREMFGVEVGLRELFERPTVKELGQSIERELRQGAGVGLPPIERREREGELPLSFAQQRLWFIDQLEPGSSFYNVPAAVRLTGKLDREALAQTLTEVIRRHEVLRTRFDTVDGRAVQVIDEAAPVELAVEDLSELEVAEREARVREWAAQEAATPFDLSHGPLLRVKLLRLGEQEHVVLLTMHHIVMDGWSFGILIREIATLYEAFIENRPSPLPELAIQYADFALWQRAYLQGEVLDQQLKYWREQLAGAQTVLQLATDNPRPATPSYRGATHKFVLPTALIAPLRKLSQEQGCTLFMTLLANFKTLLYRYTEQEDILVGTAIANRNRSETEALIGFFVNTLVLRTDLSGNPSFRKLMQRVRETTLGAYVHQDMPFEKLVEELQPERSLSQAPLFQVAFGVNNAPTQTLTLPGLELGGIEFDYDAGRFDLTLWLSEHEDGVSGIWYYNTDLFEAATIKRMQRHFETVLQNVLAQPDLPLSEIEMLTEDEKKQQLVQKQERLESNARVLRTIRRRGSACRNPLKLS